MQQAQTKKPSYLSRVQEELLKLIVTQQALDEQDAEELRQSDWLRAVWEFVRNKTATSYWNGVRDGASGRVKPKNFSAGRRG